MAFDIDQHYLWAERPKKDDSLGTTLQTVFLPFSWSLWGLIFGVTFAMGVFEVRPFAHRQAS